MVGSVWHDWCPALSECPPPPPPPPGVSAARDVAGKVDPAVTMQAMQQVQQLADKTAAEKKDE